MSRSKDWREGRTWKNLERVFLVNFLPRKTAEQLAQKGLLTITDVLEQVIAAEEMDARPIGDLGLKSYIERRLVSRGYVTIGMTDCLTEMQIRVFTSGLGSVAVRDLNEARSRFGKPSIKKF